MPDLDAIRRAVTQAVAEETGSTLGVTRIADRVIELLAETLWPEPDWD